MSLGRERALAVTDESLGVDTPDRGSKNMQVLVDGVVALTRRESSGKKGSVLQKPSLNNWARRFIVHVA